MSTCLLRLRLEHEKALRHVISQQQLLRALTPSATCQGLVTAVIERASTGATNAGILAQIQLE